MEDDLGPIVVDPHAFKALWPALAVWTFLFLTAGDGWNVLKRQLVLAAGTPAEALIEEKRRRTVSLIVGRERKYFLECSYAANGGRKTFREPVRAAGWEAVKVGSRKPIHVRGDAAFLDDDFGYSRWKLGLFGLAFVALWLWAAARYRFG